MTVAPTISFWDSAEFITCSCIMGIPHPPGSPLLSIAGRVMSMIPFYDFRGGGFESIAYRLNLMGVLAGAFTVMLTYLIVVKLITRISPFRENALHDGVIMFSGALAALMTAFSHQFWENSLETETYMPSLLLSMIAVWLALTWEEKKDTPGSLRYLLCAAYLIGLGNGIHLYVLLIVPTVLVIVVSAQPSWFNDKRLWFTVTAALVSIGLFRLAGGRAFLYVVMVFLSCAGPYLIFRAYRKTSQRWMLTLLGMLLCLSVYAIGYSVYPTVMVRAAKNPAINEGNPDTWQRYTDYLDRKQYAQGNMYSGMFKRAGSFSYQFGFMGLRYLFKQFPEWGPGIEVEFANNQSAEVPGMTVDIRDEVKMSIGLWALILFGMYSHLRRDTKKFAAFFMYFLLASVGLALYLNMQNPQVRERDYFFLGAYQIVTIWLGFGIYGILSLVRSVMERYNRPALIPAVTVVAAVVFATMAPAAILSKHIDPDYTNFQAHDRSKNYIPLDYGINMLESCPPDAILFTNGDNDTYPLWYAREVLGIRRDVRIVNLSLLNGPWYIKQLRDEDVTIPITLNDRFIDDRLCGDTLLAGRTRLWTAEPKEVTIAGLTWKMPPSRTGASGGKNIGILSVSSYMVAHIIKQNDWSRPIYFGVTVDPLSMIGLFEHMSMEGMVYRLTKEKAPPQKYSIDAPALESNIFEKYTYRGVNDTAVYKSPDTEKLMQNYSMAFIRLCEKYIELGEPDNAIRAAGGMMDLTIPDIDRRALLYSTFFRGGLTEECDRLVTQEIENLSLDDLNNSKLTGIWFLTFSMYEPALRVYSLLSERYPENIDVLKGQLTALYRLERYEDALKAADSLLKLIPGDQIIRQSRDLIRSKLESSSIQ